MNPLFSISVAIIAGLIAGRVARLVKLPGILGYLIAGLILGPSVFGVFDEDVLGKLGIVPSFALSLIAFIIGSEMKLDTFRELGKGIGIVTLAESFGAFLVVWLGVYLLTGQMHLALIFGALAPASAPAGTVAVLQETKAKGRLTNALYAVVGLDDGLAILIFAVAVALSKLIYTGESISLLDILTGPGLEIAGSILVGAVIGVVTGFFTRRLTSTESVLAVSIGSVLLCAGISLHFHFSLILANLSLGMIFVNLYTRANQKSYKAIESITLPVYILFFFIAGASLHIKLLPSMGMLGIVYIICRIFGLMGGAYLGSAIAKQHWLIRKYLGFGILSQAGVAIGLAVLASDQFKLLDEGHKVGIIVINTIAASTIVFEIIGPIGTRFAITKAGEAGANITEQDLIEQYKVNDVMSKDVAVLSAGDSLSEVIKTVSETDSEFYPLVDNDRNLIGVVTLDGIRKTFSTQELNEWLVALDIAEPVITTVSPDIGLEDALKKANKLYLQYLPVIAGKDDSKFLGLLDCCVVRRALAAEVLSRQQKADTMQLS